LLQLAYLLQLFVFGGVHICASTCMSIHDMKQSNLNTNRFTKKHIMPSVSRYWFDISFIFRWSYYTAVKSLSWHISLFCL